MHTELILGASSACVFNFYAIRSRSYTHYLMKHSGEEFFLEFTICNYLFIIQHLYDVEAACLIYKKALFFAHLLWFNRFISLDL